MMNSTNAFSSSSIQRPGTLGSAALANVSNDRILEIETGVPVVLLAGILETGVLLLGILETGGVLTEILET